VKKKRVADGVDVHCACTEIVPIAKLMPNPRNPNQHPEVQIELLAKMIEHHGWRIPITVSARSGMIVRGHGRYQAAKRAGLRKVPIDIQTYGSEQEEWADMIADNRIAELSEIDPRILRDLLTEIDTGSIDMGMTGYTEDELARLIVDGVPPTTPGLPEPDVTGLDDRGNRFTLLYETDEEREYWMSRAGLDGKKIVYLAGDIETE